MLREPEAFDLLMATCPYIFLGGGLLLAGFWFRLLLRSYESQASNPFDVLTWRSSTVGWLLAGSALPLALLVATACVGAFFALFPTVPLVGALGVGFVLFALAIADALVLLLTYSGVVLMSSRSGLGKVGLCLGLALGAPISWLIAFFYLVYRPRYLAAAQVSGSLEAFTPMANNGIDTDKPRQ